MSLSYKDLEARRAEQDRFLREQKRANAGPPENRLTTRENKLRGTWEYRLWIADSDTSIYGHSFTTQSEAEQAAQAFEAEIARDKFLLYPIGYLHAQANAMRQSPDLDQLLAGSPASPAPNPVPAAPAEDSSPRNPVRTAPRPQVMLYTDGSNHGQPGPAGWGALLVCQGRELPLSGPIPSATNNQAELTAVLKGLEALIEPCAVTLVSDSQYVVNGISKYLPGWVRRGWRASGGGEVKNRDLWEQLLKQTQRHRITATWVKGHAGHPENERVDRLAGEASRAEKERQEAARAAVEPQPLPRPLATYHPCDVCGRRARLRRLGTSPQRWCPSCYDEEMGRRRLEAQAREEVKRR